MTVRLDNTLIPCHSFSMTQAVIQAVIFDLDGTLLDSAADLTAALNHVLRREGREALSLAQTRPLVGGGAEPLLRKALSLSDHEPCDDLIKHFLDYYEAHLVDESTLYEGTLPLLAALRSRSIKVGLCTNKPLHLTTRITAALGLDDFLDGIVAYEAGGTRKPDPAHLQKALGLLGVTADTAMLVGDSMSDVLAAEALGVAMIFASYGYGSLDEGVRVTHTIGHVGEVCHVL